MGELFSKSSGHSENKAQLVETSMKKRVNPVEAWRHSVILSHFRFRRSQEKCKFYDD
jgi:hypothetical protein